MISQLAYSVNVVMSGIKVSLLLYMGKQADISTNVVDELQLLGNRILPRCGQWPQMVWTADTSEQTLMSVSSVSHQVI